MEEFGKNVLESVLKEMLPKELSGDLFDKFGKDLTGEMIAGAMMDKPNDQRSASPFLRKPLPALCHSIGVENSTRLNLEPGAQSLCEFHHFGTTVDEMTCDYLHKLPTISRLGAPWTTGMTPGTTIEGGYLGPLSQLQSVPRTVMNAPYSTVNIHPTTWETALILSGTRYWRGSIKFKFHVVASPLMTGRIAFCPLYGVYARPTVAMTINQAMGYAMHVHDLQDESNTFEVEVPYVSMYPYLKVCNGVPNTDAAYATTVGTLAENVELAKWFFGAWRLVVLNPLNCPDTCPNTVYINIYMSGGNDFVTVGNFDQNATLQPFMAGAADGEPHSGWDNQASIGGSGWEDKTSIGGDGVVAPDETGKQELGAVAIHEREVVRETHGRGCEAKLSKMVVGKDHNWTLPDMMKKLNLLKTGVWNTTHIAGTELEKLRIPTDVLLPLGCGQSTHATVWNNFRYVRWQSISITVTINSNKFQVGSLNLNYYPGLNPTAFTARSFGTPASQTTVTHGIIQAGMSNSITLKLPWINGMEYMTTENYNINYLTNPWQELGTLGLVVWNPLLVGATQPGTVAYSIFVEFNGLEPHVPRVMPSFGDGFDEINDNVDKDYVALGIPHVGEDGAVDDVRNMASSMKKKRAVIDKAVVKGNTHFGEHLKSYKDLMKRYTPFMSLQNKISAAVNDGFRVENTYTSSVAFPASIPIEHVTGTQFINYRGPIGAMACMYGFWRGDLRYMVLHRIDKSITAQNQVYFNPIDNGVSARMRHLGFDTRTVTDDVAVSNYVADIFAADPSIYKLDTNASLFQYAHNSRGTTNAIDFTDDGASWNWVEVPYWSQYKIMKVPFYSSEGGTPNGYFDHIVLGEVVATTIFRTAQAATDLYDEVTCLVAAGDNFRFGCLYGALIFTFRIFINGLDATHQLTPALYDPWPVQPTQY